MKISADDPTFGAQSGSTTGVIAGTAADAAVVEHVADTSDAHGATGISIIDPSNVRYWPMLALSSGLATSGNYYGSTNVEGALAEIGAALAGLGNGVTRHWPMLALSSGANERHARQHSVTSAPDHTFPGGTTTFLRADGSFAAPPGASGGDVVGQFIAGWDGGGAALTAGAKVDIVAPFTGTITGWTLLADTAGSAVVDVWKDTYANFPPTVADTVTAAAKPTLSAATKATSTTLTGWTTAVTAGAILRFNLDSASTLTRLLLVLDYSRP